MRESWTYKDGKLIKHEVKATTPKWEIEEAKTIAANMDDKNCDLSKVVKAISVDLSSQPDNLGIGFLVGAYIELSHGQNLNEEYEKIERLLFVYKLKYAKDNGLTPLDVNIKFINYGKTQLVYVLTDKNDKKVTLLAKQPAVKFGKVKQEAENLTELKKIDKNVVAPIDYFSLDEQELYVTPYINQARCVASDRMWGMYIPEPYYRFESFSPEQENIVTTCMIAKLISYYDPKRQEGISACKLGGGDFMLPKGWEKKKPTISNTLNNLYFIAARDKVHCSLDEYINIIRREFSVRTIEMPQDNLIINHRGRVKINNASIENGIKLGKKLIKSRQIGVID